VRTALTVGERVTGELLSFLEGERRELEPEALPLLDEIEALIRAGGKRLRPRFCYWGFVAGGGRPGREILRVAASLELLHTFALIHDDVMDASSLRRGRATAFRALGPPAAILTGLLGFVLADRLFTTAGFSPEAVARASDRFDRMRARAIAGQHLDLLAARSREPAEETAWRIAELKSASYTVTDPLVMGALCATDDRRVIEMLEAYGVPLGLAFQMRDDVLGVFGDPSETGKDRDGDLREGKQTVLVARALRLATGEQRAFLARALGDPELTPSGAERAREIIVTTGALDATEETILELTGKATGALDAGLLGPEAAEALASLADEVTQRVR
jgi:geranylgeranyl diphosphate synthase type I